MANVSDWDDIAYNYLVAEDGIAYEGRGYKYVSATAYGWNQKSIGVAFVGDYLKRRPPEQSIAAMTLLLDHLVEQGKI